MTDWLTLEQALAAPGLRVAPVRAGLPSPWSEFIRACFSATASIQAGLEKPQTTHFSIIDRAGNAVSNTYTLNGDSARDIT